MKKVISLLSAAVLLAGCGNTVSSQTVSNMNIPEGMKILTVSGGPAIALLPVINSNLNDIIVTDDRDEIMDAFETDSGYDVIIAPADFRTETIVSDGSDFISIALVTDGNLYLVGTSDALKKGHTVAVYGKDSSEGKIFDAAYPKIEADVNWVDNVSSAAEELKGGNADGALLCEPYASAAIAAAREQGVTLKILSDFSDYFNKNGGNDTALYVRSEAYEQNRADYELLLKAMSDYAEHVDLNDPEQLITDINVKGSEYYGVPSAEMIAACYEALNIDIREKK